MEQADSSLIGYDCLGHLFFPLLIIFSMQFSDQIGGGSSNGRMRWQYGGYRQTAPAL